MGDNQSADPTADPFTEGRIAGQNVSSKRLYMRLGHDLHNLAQISAHDGHRHPADGVQYAACCEGSIKVKHGAQGQNETQMTKGSKNLQFYWDVIRSRAIGSKDSPTDYRPVMVHFRRTAFSLG